MTHEEFAKLVVEGHNFRDVIAAFDAEFAALAEARREADEEARRWQDRIEAEIVAAGLAPLDASGNESGDPLDWTADQVRRALNDMSEAAEARAAEAEKTRGGEAVTREEQDFIDSFPKGDRGTVRLVLRVLRACALIPDAALSAPAEEAPAPRCDVCGDTGYVTTNPAETDPLCYSCDYWERKVGGVRKASLLLEREARASMALDGDTHDAEGARCPGWQHTWKWTPALTWACAVCGESAPDVQPGGGDPIRVVCPACDAPGFTRAELALHKCGGTGRAPSAEGR